MATIRKHTEVRGAISRHRRLVYASFHLAKTLLFLLLSGNMSGLWNLNFQRFVLAYCKTETVLSIPLKEMKSKDLHKYHEHKTSYCGLRCLFCKMIIFAMIIRGLKTQ